MTRDMISHLRHEPVNLREHTGRLQQKGGEIGFEKKDFMALTGIFIADAWKPMYEWIEEHNRALPEIVRHGELAGTFVENRPDDFANEKFPETIIESIRGQIKNFYKFYLDRWYKEQERLLAEYKRGVLPIEQEEKIKKYSALRDFVSNGGKNENVEQQYYPLFDRLGEKLKKI